MSTVARRLEEEELQAYVDGRLDPERLALVSLRVVGRANVGAEVEAPGERRQLAQQRAQEGGLAATVRADQRHAVAALDLQFGRAREFQLSRAVLVADPQYVGAEDDTPAPQVAGDRELQHLGLLLAHVAPFHYLALLSTTRQ